MIKTQCCIAAMRFLHTRRNGKSLFRIVKISRAAHKSVMAEFWFCAKKGRRHLGGDVAA
jgi:hypothetical protein